MKKLLSILLSCALIAPASTIPFQYFGLTVNFHSGTTTVWPLAVTGGTFRLWDSGPIVQMQSLYVCNSTTANCLAHPDTYTSLATADSGGEPGLDTYLKHFFDQNANDGLYTGGRIPAWAQGATSFTPACNYNAGSCVLPLEMNKDGSCSGTLGTATSVCSVWDNFYHLLALHVNDATFLLTHAHIKYWETWNEWFEDPVINSGAGSTEVNATYAQMLRLTEDMRCVIKGVGNIHNYPTAGSSTTCSAYLSSLGWTAPDSSALITLPSGHSTSGWNYISINFLYCNHSPTLDNSGATTCNWAPASNNTVNCNSASCWGSNTIDVLNEHFYFNNNSPENETTTEIAGMQSLLSTTDAAKPLMCGECSPGDQGFGGNIWNDNYSAAAAIVRAFALFWSKGISIFHLYAYNSSANLATDAAVITTQGTAYQTMLGWLSGANVTASPFCTNSGTVYTCTFIRANGKPAEMVWDSKYGPAGTTAPTNCTTATNPLICGSTSYSVPGAYSLDLVDMVGTTHAYSASITIGASPQLLEGPLGAGNPCIISGKAKLSGSATCR